jgi:hypothetical protein
VLALVGFLLKSILRTGRFAGQSPDMLLSSKVSTIWVANLSRLSGANPGIIGRRVFQRDNVQLIMLLSRSIN